MSDPKHEFDESIDRLIGAAWSGDHAAIERELDRPDGALAAIKAAKKQHPKCELCRDFPDGFHCWLVVYYDEDDAPSDDLIGMPYGTCRHCPATGEVCVDCDGEGYVYPDYDGDDQDDEGGTDAIDCPTCEGWGVIWTTPNEGAK